VDVVQEGDSRVAPADPAALRARLKRRVAPPSSNSTANAPTTAYDKVLDTARRLAELESQRSQDQIYIRTLEQTRATLMRDAQSAARARAEAERAIAGEREARRRREEAEVARDEAVRVVGVERARAERAEGRVREVENRLRGSEERVGELEDALEGERKRRIEWESGLEALV
jgi:chromosome segregation ATPase